MRDLDGRVAVVTGGGSGIGQGMAWAFAREGMSVVVADVDLAAAEGTVDNLRQLGARAVAIQTDVSNLSDVQRLAESSFSEFDRVDILCNNAGVSLRGRSGIHATHNDWRWLMGVNMWGLIHGLEAFLPRLLEQPEAHIVNTGSMYSFIPSANSALYSATKYGIRGISETIKNELHDTNVGVSLLCPCAVSTRSAEAERSRPSSLPSPPPDGSHTPSAQYIISSPMDPKEVGKLVVKGVQEDRFYIFTDPLLKDLIEARHNEILRDFDMLGS